MRRSGVACCVRAGDGTGRWTYTAAKPAGSPRIASWLEGRRTPRRCSNQPDDDHFVLVRAVADPGPARSRVVGMSGHVLHLLAVEPVEVPALERGHAGELGHVVR